MNFSALLVYMLVMSFTPGPNNLMCLYLGAKSGLKGASRFMTASMASLFVKTLLCGFLNIILAEKIPAVVPYLKWVGALYMLYLAFSMVRSGLKSGSEEVREGESTYLSGILLQCLNIKSWIAALSIFSVYVIPYTTNAGTIVMVTAVFIATALAASLLWCFCGRAIQRIYSKWKLPVSILLALTLVYCAYTALL